MTNEWDRYNRLISQTDALGNTTRYEYDGAGNLTTAIRPDGRVTQAEYNELNQIVHAVTAGGSTWRYRYDDRGNHTATVDYEGSETLYAYDEIGGLVAVTDVAGRTSLARCNTAGLPLEFTDAEGGTSRVERDSFGRVRSFTDPLGGVTRFGFTIEGRPVLREGADGFREISEWDAEGNLVSQADRAENSTRYKIGPFGQVVERTLSDGSTYSFGYDTELNLLHVSDPSERSWQYRYDEANRVTSETDFNGRTVAYELNAMGDLLSRTNGAGQVIEFRRDVLGRTLETHYDGEVSYYTYDEAGNLVREAGPDATVEREFSAAGQILSESIDGRTTTYEYDARGRRTKRRTPTGIESTWTYDEAGHPTALDTAGHRIDFGFDRAHRETARHLPGGVALTQTWDNAGRLAAQRLSRIPDQHAHPQDQDEVLLQQREYAYRPDGIPTEIRDLTTGTRRFTLDPAGRVTAVEARRWTETYQYDEVGNISHAATPGAEDTVGDRVLAGTRVQRAGRTRYEHDAEGRVVRVIHRLLSGRHRVQSYLWNSRNQLVGTTTPDGTRWRYRYDPAGRRVAKQRLDDEGSVADEVLFVWDDTRLIEQVTKNGRVTAWDYEPGGHRPVAQFDRADQDQDARFHAIVADLSGAPAELVSTDGEVAWQQRTLLWGGSLSAGLREETTAGSVDCPLRFEGQYADAETGWHYNFQRYYDPRIGQYVSSDPLGLAPAPNDRAYVPNPYRWADPLGLAWQDPNNGMRFGRDPSLPPADEDGREFTRSSQYPSDYRVSTHDHMVTHYTDEGRALNGVPRDSNNQRIPRDQLTWRDGDRNLLWDPRANNTQPFHRAVTYEHLDPVVAHWNREGRFSDRASRNDFYNNTDHMEPMNGRENSRGGGRMTDTYTQETGEGYSCS
ncbi:RHS repeat-associated core domain-containing protein [Streptomyces sp. NPDC059900]